MAGEVASLALSRMAVPILFYMEEKGVLGWLRRHPRPLSRSSGGA
jgi:hypothetical protein